MVVLAHQLDHFVTSNEIAESTGTNPVVLRRIAAALQVASLVETQKGPGGGIRLSRPPESIRLDEIYRAVESGESLHLPHTAPNPACPVGRAMEHVLKELFTRAELAMQRELGEQSLAQFVKAIQSYQPEPAQ
jgi:Rrf2 family protein